MWTHHVCRLVQRPVAEVRADIDELVRWSWARWTDVSTTEHNGVRTDWIATGRGRDEIDVALSWHLVDLDEATFVTLTLDEFEPGPSPLAGLEEILDALADPTPLTQG
jgi:hypothetical protein